MRHMGGKFLHPRVQIAFPTFVLFVSSVVHHIQKGCHQLPDITIIVSSFTVLP